MNQQVPAGGYIDHPLRTFRVFVVSGEWVDVKAHLVSPEGGALTFLTISNGLPYATRGFSHGSWRDYTGSIPSQHEIEDLRARAQQTIDARAAFDKLGDTQSN